MPSRKRRPDEPYEVYRASLRLEKIATQAKLSGIGVTPKQAEKVKKIVQGLRK